MPTNTTAPVGLALMNNISVSPGAILTEFLLLDLLRLKMAVSELYKCYIRFIIFKQSDASDLSLLWPI